MARPTSSSRCLVMPAATHGRLLACSSFTMGWRSRSKVSSKSAYEAHAFGRTTKRAHHAFTFLAPVPLVYLPQPVAGSKREPARSFGNRALSLATVFRLDRGGFRGALVAGDLLAQTRSFP